MSRYRRKPKASKFVAVRSERVGVTRVAVNVNPYGQSKVGRIAQVLPQLAAEALPSSDAVAEWLLYAPLGTVFEIEAFELPFRYDHARDAVARERRLFAVTSRGTWPAGKDRLNWQASRRWPFKHERPEPPRPRHKNLRRACRQRLLMESSLLLSG